MSVDLAATIGLWIAIGTLSVFALVAVGNVAQNALDWIARRMERR